MKSNRPEDRRVVYSTGPSRQVCSQCGETTCRCEESEAPRPGEVRPRVQREKGGRGGKMVTVVYELNLSESALKDLCGRLKRQCASGGTVKNGTIEIQGDHALRLVQALAKEGYKARRSGG